MLPTSTDLVCFSHLRWDFVYQRPQHLMSRFAQRHRVFFMEEPIERPGRPRFDITRRPCGALVLVPHLPPDTDNSLCDTAQRDLLLNFLETNGSRRPVLWYCTPMALGFSRGIEAAAVVYDCLDELSAFLRPPPGLAALEAELLQCADLVFTGGRSLYRAKRGRNPSTHLFPSSVDVGHFQQARWVNHPKLTGGRHWRVGYMGVIDERMDLALLDRIADARPEWELLIVGPVVKIDPARLPRRPNIQYLGFCPYSDLPGHLATWDVAMIPFAQVAATEFVSPTKLLEYFAAGLPVVSTPIRDVVEPYGTDGVVQIATTPQEWLIAIEIAVAQDPEVRLSQYEAVLAQTSWNQTWCSMVELIEEAVTRRHLEPAAVPP